jgi:hypothetical protein
MRIHFALLAVLIPFSAYAGGANTGNDFYKTCGTSDQFIVGYIGGVLDRRQDEIDWFLPRAKAQGETEAGRAIVDDLNFVRRNICLPDGADLYQARDIFCKYLGEHPETRHLSGAVLVVDALEQAWPCVAK